jgi:hypothetical protein
MLIFEHHAYFKKHDHKKFGTSPSFLFADTSLKRCPTEPRADQQQVSIGILIQPLS